jgi:hypothetical protein
MTEGLNPGYSSGEGNYGNGNYFFNKPNAFYGNYVYSVDPTNYEVKNYGNESVIPQHIMPQDITLEPYTNVDLNPLVDENHQPIFPDLGRNGRGNNNTVSHPDAQRVHQYLGTIKDDPNKPWAYWHHKELDDWLNHYQQYRGGRFAKQKTSGIAADAEMVPVEWLKQYHEYDRPGRGPEGYAQTKPEYWDRLKNHIQQHGFEDPLTLEYNPDSGNAYLGEGNHRLGIAEELGMTHVPVHVYRNSKDWQGHPWVKATEPGQYVDERGYFPQSTKPSAIGIPTSGEPYSPSDTDDPSSWYNMNRQAKQKIADYYHMAPTTERARIQQHGLQPSNPQLEGRWRLEDAGFDPEFAYMQNQHRDTDPGVYMSTDPESVKGYGKEDVWRIDPSYVDETKLRTDPYWDNAKISPNAIPPESLTLHQPVEDQLWDNQEREKTPMEGPNFSNPNYDKEAAARTDAAVSLMSQYPEWSGPERMTSGHRRWQWINPADGRIHHVTCGAGTHGGDASMEDARNLKTRVNLCQKGACNCRSQGEVPQPQEAEQVPTTFAPGQQVSYNGQSFWITEMDGNLAVLMSDSGEEDIVPVTNLQRMGAAILDTNHDSYPERFSRVANQPPSHECPNCNHPLWPAGHRGFTDGNATSSGWQSWRCPTCEADFKDPANRPQPKTANILDPISSHLDPAVFIHPEAPDPQVNPKLNRWVHRAVHAALEKHGYEGPQRWLKMFLTGSLCTYQYSPEADFDLNLFVDSAKFPEWSRAEMIGILTTALDGQNLPGTNHPLQIFVSSKELGPKDKFKPGLRAAYDLDADKWLVPPDKHAAHDVEHEMNTSYIYALEVADKMDRLLRYEPDKAVHAYNVLHKLRKSHDGEGEFNQYNIAYKYLSNHGYFDKLRKLGVPIH